MWLAATVLGMIPKLGLKYLSSKQSIYAGLR